MASGIRIQQLGQLVQGFRNLYTPPPGTIPGINSANWPTAGQPVRPLGPPGSQPLGMPIQFGQNQIYTPRSDAEFTAQDLKALSTYPLARICIENVKDQLCQLPWRIQLRPLPGETPTETTARRKVEQHGDEFIRKMSLFLERPDGKTDWSTWIRRILEDMLVTDAASIEIQKTFSGKLARLRWIPGDSITRYVDDTGETPGPPYAAYSQLWQGIPRVNLSTDQLVYMPRNIVPRASVSSYLYGYSPVEQVSEEIQIGMMRLQFVKRYYDSGALPEFLHLVPSKTSTADVEKAMNWVNGELAGNLDRRRQYRIIQGFSEDGKGDQIIFPKEPTLADVFDDLHIRKICFAFGTAPQRLMRQMNRASAQISQDAAEEEGIRPWKVWIESALVGNLLWRCSGTHKYQMYLELEHETDELKKSKVDQVRVAGGIRTINDINRDNGDEISTDPAADQLAITTPQGRIPIGQLPPTFSMVPRGGGPEPTGPVRPHGRPNGGIQ